MVVFGGFSSAETGEPGLEDVWALANADLATEGAAWRRMDPAGVAPAGRAGHAASYDPGSRRMIVFGGAGTAGGCQDDYGDLWLLLNPTGTGDETPEWLPVDVTGSATPPPRSGHSAVYDAASNRLIVFGGGPTCGAPTSEVWVLSNANASGPGAPVWSLLAPAGVPPAARRAHTATLDAAGNRMVVFGGASGDARMNDAWVLEGANGTGAAPAWHPLAPAGPPPQPRSGHRAAYDAERNRLVISGGDGVRNDVWVLTNANGEGGTPAWTPVPVAGVAPPPRGLPAVAYRATTRRLTMFGGAGCSGGTCTALGDTWVLELP